MIENNPLRQYFRRPSIYIKLPSGYKNYPEGVIDVPEAGELPVFPMTAIDEITVNTPDALFNGTAIVEIITSCVPSIKDPWRLSSVDLDTVLLAIKSASGGNDMEIETTCPACQEASTYGVNLVGLLTSIKSGDYDTELAVNDLLIKLRPLTYKEMTEVGLGQFELQKMFAAIDTLENLTEKTNKQREALKTITDITMTLLAKTIEYIKTPSSYVDQKDFILDFLKNCDKGMFESIRNHNTSLKTKSEVKPLPVKCISCGHEYSQPFSINAADFFG
jgi:hypothetical protein